MSRRHAPERESGYGRDDRGDRGDRRERDARTVQREREAGSRTPVRTTADVRPTTSIDTRTVAAIDPRSAVQTRVVAESRDPRDARAVVDSRSTRDPRDPRDSRETRDTRDIRDTRDPRDNAFGRDPRIPVDPNDRRTADVGRDLARDTRTAPPAVTRGEIRDPRSRPEEISPRQAPTNDYFLPEDDISREVITADICRYLGPDALVRPYRHQDGRNGYLITAYRALTSAMITTLKQDSLKFEADNRRRVNAGHRPQTYAPAPAGFDQSSRIDPYGDDRNGAPMSRVDSRFAREPEPRRSRAQPSGYDEMDLDDPMDSRDPRYARDAYDPRDPRARPPVPTGYANAGRDAYPYDTRSDPRLDARVDTRMDTRMDPRGDPRLDQRVDPRMDPRGYPQAAPMAVDRDYPMGDSRTAYGDRATQPIYAAARPDSYGALPPSQAGAVPRGARDEPQVFIDPRTGQPVLAAPRSDVRHAPSNRADRMDYDPRGYR